MVIINDRSDDDQNLLDKKDEDFCLINKKKLFVDKNFNKELVVKKEKLKRAVPSAPPPNKKPKQESKLRKNLQKKFISVFCRIIQKKDTRANILIEVWLRNL